MQAPSDRESARYGAPLMSRRAVVALAAVGAVVFLAVVAFVGVRFAAQPVKAEMQSYEHVSDATVAVTFQVTMPPGTEARCQLQAMNGSRAQVGFVDVHIPAQERRQTVQRAEIATQGAAVSAEVLGCEPA